MILSALLGITQDFIAPSPLAGPGFRTSIVDLIVALITATVGVGMLTRQRWARWPALGYCVWAIVGAFMPTALSFGHISATHWNAGDAIRTGSTAFPGAAATSATLSPMQLRSLIGNALFSADSRRVVFAADQIKGYLLLDLDSGALHRGQRHPYKLDSREQLIGHITPDGWGLASDFGTLEDLSTGEQRQLASFEPLGSEVVGFQTSSRMLVYNRKASVLSLLDVAADKSLWSVSVSPPWQPFPSTYPNWLLQPQGWSRDRSRYVWHSQRALNALDLNTQRVQFAGRAAPADAEWHADRHRRCSQFRFGKSSIPAGRSRLRDCALRADFRGKTSRHRDVSVEGSQRGSGDGRSLTCRESRVRSTQRSLTARCDVFTIWRKRSVRRYQAKRSRCVKLDDYLQRLAQARREKRNRLPVDLERALLTVVKQTV